MTGLAHELPDSEQDASPASHGAPYEGRWTVDEGNESLMEMRCADCGCLVDRGEVIERCGNPECCCKDLPDKNAEIDS